MQYFWRLALVAAAIMLPVTAMAQTTLGNNYLYPPKISNIYNARDYPNGCAEDKERRWTISDKIPMCCPQPGCRTITGKCRKKCETFRGNFDYWEPAAIVEVSCRNGYSFLKPELQGRGNRQQQSCGTGPNWFFEARVWTSVGRGNGGGTDRAAALGIKWQEGSTQCSVDGSKSAIKFPQGYGKKHAAMKFSNFSGPGGSMEAYISDEDASWTKPSGGGNASPPACNGGVNMRGCWGDDNQQHGWITHMNQASAAALVGHRALKKAQGTGKAVTPGASGWRMSMDYPFIMQNSPFAQSMGISDGGGGRHMGSNCFKPGEAGPWWFTTNQKNQNPKELIRNLTAGDRTKAAEVATGVYIFTYWVRTRCTVWVPEVQPTCVDDQKE